MILPDATRTLNVAVVAEPRSGAAALVSALNSDSGQGRVWCHLGLLHDTASIRRHYHTRYFGDDKLDALDEWFCEGYGLTSPVQYLNHFVFDNPRHGESVIGCYIPMTAVRRWELAEYFATRCHEGDFCVILVHRNDAATFVSLKQAQQTQRWTRRETSRAFRPATVRVDPIELTEHCRLAQAARQRIRQSCSDLYEISYLDILQRFNATVQSVLEFLEIESRDERANTALARLYDRDMPDRVSNLADLIRNVPRDVAELLNAEDFL